MVNSHNTFDPLKEIIIGDIGLDSIMIDDPRKQQRVEYIFKKTKDELNAFQEVLESRGIKVYRPTSIQNTEIKTPYWSSPGTRIPLTPRDIFLILGDTIIETAMCEQERFFEPFYYRDIVVDKFQKGAKWLAMPPPRHDYRNFSPEMADQVPNQDPIIDAPSVLKYGKDLFVNTCAAANKLGFKWLQSNFGDTYNFHEINCPEILGHLDSHMSILRPGLMMTYHDRKVLPDYFKDWDIVKVNPDADKEKSKSQTLIDSRIQDGDFENTVLAVNCVSLDRNTIVCWEHYKSNKSMIEQLEKHDIEIIFIPFSYAHFFNQGVNCCTLDLVREHPDGLISYKNL